MQYSKSEVFEKIKRVLLDALEVLDDDEVTPEAKIFGDLGAESIDFLDIVFRLERAFEIEIARVELFHEDIVNNPEYLTGSPEMHSSQVTSEGIELLKERVPYRDFTEFEKNPLAIDLDNFLTVNDLQNYIATKVTVVD